MWNSIILPNKKEYNVCMKHLKTFEGFKDWFKSKEQKDKENLYATKDLSGENNISSQIMIDCEPYEESQFGQSKYGVYIESNDTRYYIGDLRSFKTKPDYISYLNIDKVIEKEPEGVLCHPNEEQMKIIDQELDKNYLSPNLMDDTITYREFLKKKNIPMRFPK